jgi:hypothetical protein
MNDTYLTTKNYFSPEALTELNLGHNLIPKRETGYSLDLEHNLIPELGLHYSNGINLLSFVNFTNNAAYITTIDKNTEILQINEEIHPAQTYPQWLDAFRHDFSCLEIDVKNDGDDINEKSKQFALDFILRIGKSAMPAPFLMGDEVRLVWKVQSNLQVSLQFLENGYIRFNGFFEMGGKIQIICGEMTQEALLEFFFDSKFMRSMWGKHV